VNLRSPLKKEKKKEKDQKKLRLNGRRIVCPQERLDDEISNQTLREKRNQGIRRGKREKQQKERKSTRKKK